MYKCTSFTHIAVLGAFISVLIRFKEVFFQIVHSRLPLLNPAQFRTRLHYSLQSSNGGASPNNPQGGAGQVGRSSNSPPHGGPQQKPLHPA